MSDRIEEERGRLIAGLEDAIALAVTSHCGQTTLDGQPYILHPLRVMLSFTAPEDEDARIAAVLHDVVEDTHVTLNDLLVRGFGSHVVEAIEYLTRCEDEKYKDYIKRVGSNHLAKRVKVADLLDNLGPSRLSTAMLPASQREKYLEALQHLRSV